MKNKSETFRIVRRMMLSAIVIILGVYVGLGMLLYLVQESFIYFPHKGLTSSPEDMHLKYEDVYLTTADGVKIHGWFIPADNAEMTILYCHGNAGNISHRLDTINIYHELGVNFFIFDYRGYGNSEGSISEAGSYKDVDAAWKYLRETKKIPADRIIIMGRSLGGAVAANLATRTKPTAFICEEAFTSIPDMAAKMYPVYPIRLMTRVKYPTIDYIKKIACPKMIVHSVEDDIIPYSHGERLFNEAMEPKQFLKLTGSHNDCFFVSMNYIPEMKEFIDYLCKRKSEKSEGMKE